MTSLSPLRALVIGFGSIGGRHAGILEKLGLSVAIVSRRCELSTQFSRYRGIAEAIDAVSPNYVVIATETVAHAENLKGLLGAGYVGPVLVEKPLFERPEAAVFGGTPAMSISSEIYVGYQLRFDPIAIQLREMISAERCITAEFHVGQHLDGWRQGRAARDSYSAHAAMGGGVLRDLSHELDLAQFLFGRCQRVAALGGRLTELTADSDDAWGVIAQFEHCPIVTFQLNYLDPTSRRRIVVVAEACSISADFVARSLISGDNNVSLKCERNAPFEAMHRSVIELRGRDVCDYASGQRVVEMINAIERAASIGAWVEP
jgi:predicted dehydrogenase